MTLLDLHVELLNAHSPLVDTVVNWHWHEWSGGHDEANFDQWRAGVRSRTNQREIPFTFVAHLDGQPVGCVSVCDDDVDRRFADRGPWLTGMFVVGRARNLGVGRKLVQASEEQARAFGATELWLYTAEAGPFYTRCGYRYAHRKEHMHDNAVLWREL